MPEPSRTEAGVSSLQSVSLLASQPQTFFYSVSQSVKLGHLLLWGLPRDYDPETEGSQRSSFHCLKLLPILELSFQPSTAVPRSFRAFYS